MEERLRVKACGRISIDMETHGEQRREEGISNANLSLDTVGRATARPVILLVSGGQWR
jgi:hypothetical protein